MVRLEFIEEKAPSLDLGLTLIENNPLLLSVSFGVLTSIRMQDRHLFHAKLLL